MSSTVVFTKMEGAGNDFIILDARKPLPFQLSGRISKLCDRHFGIGADGVVVIEPSTKAEFRVSYFNADGSRAVCGNGTRCAASFLYRVGAVLSRTFQLETDDRLVGVDAIGGGDLVRVDMGEPEFSGLQIPVAESGEQLDIGLRVGEELVTLSAVSMGNPHAVMFVDSTETAAVERLGSAIEIHPFFPKRTNVEFVQIVDRAEVKLRIWERGVGETLACGTGNCAVVAAGVRTGRLDRQVKLHSPGGEFLVTWNEETNRISLTGPAREVYRGEFSLSEF